VWVDGEDAPRGIAEAEHGGRVPVIRLESITTREAAAALVGRYLEAESPALEPGSYYWEDLVGLRAESPNGRNLGELAEVFRAGGNEVYRIVGPEGERLVPALRSVVLEIEVERGRIVVADDEAEELR
jgi:16S rRNA processing protein RimM